MSTSLAVVITTVNDVTDFVNAYKENTRVHSENPHFIIVADKKTPVQALRKLSPIDLTVLTCDIQEAFLMKHYPELYSTFILPWNTIARSNVGRLWAYDKGYDGILMLDDDNWPTAANFVRDHNVVGETRTLHLFKSGTGWYNVADALVEQFGVDFYPRGYPPAQRWVPTLSSRGTARKRIAVNAGLWLGDPDIDAITRLERPLRTVGYNADAPRTFGLYPGTWCPWNSQNTAIMRDALVTYWMSPYAGRHQDIWASYISSLAIEKMGDVVAFGKPLVNHVRTPHNLYRDLDDELPWVEATDEFVKTLRELDLKTVTQNSTYVQIMRSIVNALEPTEWTKDNHAYWIGLNTWVTMFEKKEKG